MAILNMLDAGVANLFEGTDNNQPSHAVTMTARMRVGFRKFKVYFKHIRDSTYYIGTFDDTLILGPYIPATRTLSTHPAIDPPSQRLLALHCAIGHILHISKASDYIDKLLEETE